MRLTWSEKAEADLDEVWRFTRRRWGVSQADAYLGGIKAALQDPIALRRQAKPIGHVKEELYRVRVIRHFVYFRFTEDAVNVSRVLHDSMDETLHLP